MNQSPTVASARTVGSACDAGSNRLRDAGRDYERRVPRRSGQGAGGGDLDPAARFDRGGDESRRRYEEVANQLHAGLGATRTIFDWGARGLRWDEELARLRKRSDGRARRLYAGRRAQLL